MTDQPVDITDLDAHLAKLNGIAAALLRAERVKMLGERRVKTVWFDNQSCDFYLPDALDDRIQGVLLMRGGFFEESLLRQIRKYITAEATVIDIGANIGNHSMFFAKICGAKKVYSFEPQARLVEIVERNKELNGLTDEQVTVFNVGCGEKNSRLRMIHHNIGNLGATQFTEDEDGGFEVRRVDDCGIEKVHFMKIDAERMGDRVLLGAERLIDDNSPVIWIELYGDEGERATKILSRYGYCHTRAMTKVDHLFSRAPI